MSHLKKEMCAQRGLNETKWLKKVKQAVASKLRIQNRINKGCPGMTCSIEICETAPENSIWDDMSGKIESKTC